MAAQHLRMLENDFENLGKIGYSALNDENMPPAMILIENMVAKAMSECERSTKITRHVVRRYHYVRQGSARGDHRLAWINEKNQCADIGSKAQKLADYDACVDKIVVEVQLD